MRQEVKHIFDSSACLSKRQLRDYVNGIMTVEECHALEHHINSCFFCSEAIEGITEHKEAIASVDGLNTTFLKDHFSITHPHIHLNSMALAAPAATVSRKQRAHTKVQPLLRPSGFAAFLLLALAIMWYLQSGKQTIAGSPATQSSAAAPASHSPGNDNEDPVSQEPNNNTVAASIAGASVTTSETPSSDIKPQPSSVLADAKPEPAKKQEARKEIAPANEVPATLPKRQPSATDEHMEKIPVHQPKATESTDKPSGISRLFNSLAGDDKNASDAKSETGNAESSKAPEKEITTLEKGHQEATLSAAKVQISQGEREKAAKLLESVISEGSGSQKRQAKRLLRDLNKDTE